MTFDEALRRIRQDPAFYDLVKLMVRGYEELKWTPGEIREAASFAALLFYRNHPFPAFFDPGPEPSVDAPAARPEKPDTHDPSMG